MNIVLKKYKYTLVNNEQILNIRIIYHYTQQFRFGYQIIKYIKGNITTVEINKYQISSSDF